MGILDDDSNMDEIFLDSMFNAGGDDFDGGDGASLPRKLYDFIFGPKDKSGKLSSLICVCINLGCSKVGSNIVL